MLSLLTLLLAPAPALLPPQPPALIRLDGRDGDDEHKDRGRHEGWRKDRGHGDDQGEDRDRRREDKYWRHHDKWEKHDFHEGHDHDGDRDWDFDHPRHAHPAPPWMNTWWGANDRHYCAVVPGDPSQVFVLIGSHWERHSIYDPRFRADISGAFTLPAAPPPPVPLPHLGLNLRIVLFN